MTAKCMLMGVEKQTSSKNGKEYAHAALFFPVDKTLLNCGIDPAKPEMYKALESLGMCNGEAIIGIREMKGIKFLDLVEFKKV